MYGFVIGKFCPPHLGHDYLIRTALAATTELTIIVCGKKGQPILPELRVQWLQETYPTASVRLLDQDSFDDTDEAAWTAATLACLGKQPDSMFTSEDYGDHYADLLHCKHVVVDKKRETVPVSASLIMQDPQKYREFILPSAQKYFR